MSKPMSKQNKTDLTRREFVTQAAVGAFLLAGAPAIVRANKTDSQIIMGQGDYKYEVTHAFPELPDKFNWQTTHNVAVDKAGNLYVIHEGHANQPEHPSIFVFDSKGKYIRSFGNQFQGGGHGIEVRQEGSEEFLYVCAYQQVKAFAKMTLTGEVLWLKHAPMESGVYAKDEDTHPQKVWGQDRFMPTNFAFLDDGGFLLADGYGSFYIHRYDKDANWVSMFGGPGAGEGKFKTPHGIWIDRRPGREAQIVVCDRAHDTLQYFTMEGNYLETLTGYGLPANIDTWNDLLLVPELKSRLSILNGKNEVVAQLGFNEAGVNQATVDRTKPETWQTGKFVHPHDACFAENGDIFVAEWVGTGRISKLTRLN